MELLPNKDFYNFKLYTDLPNKTWMECREGGTQTTVVVIQEANDEALALLEKILTAVKQDLKKDCFVLQQATPVAYKDLKQIIEIQRLLIFGWSPADLGLHLQIRPYQLVSFEGSQLLFSHNLAAIAENRNREKQQLWGQLQQLFK